MSSKMGLRFLSEFLRHATLGIQKIEQLALGRRAPLLNGPLLWFAAL